MRILPDGVTPLDVATNELTSLMPRFDYTPPPTRPERYAGAILAAAWDTDEAAAVLGEHLLMPVEADPTAFYGIGCSCRAVEWVYGKDMSEAEVMDRHRLHQAEMLQAWLLGGDAA